jgi:GT2 family glycosyltransferase
MSDISVVIATYGDRQWIDLALERALHSVLRQSLPARDVHIVHGTQLHEARNEGARRAQGGWLCFLDADDELDHGYLAAMTEATPRTGLILLQPATLGITDGRQDPQPVVIPSKRLIDGNYMVIGTLIQAQLFSRVGGFHDWAYAEDWDLWLRAWLQGARSKPVPAAVYRVHVRPDGRNNCDRSLQVRTYREIRDTHLEVFERIESASRHRPPDHH